MKEEDSIQLGRDWRDSLSAPYICCFEHDFGLRQLAYGKTVNSRCPSLALVGKETRQPVPYVLCTEGAWSGTAEDHLVSVPKADNSCQRRQTRNVFLCTSPDEI